MCKVDSPRVWSDSCFSNLFIFFNAEEVGEERHQIRTASEKGASSVYQDVLINQVLGEEIDQFEELGEC